MINFNDAEKKSINIMSSMNTFLSPTIKNEKKISRVIQEN